MGGPRDRRGQVVTADEQGWLVKDGLAILLRSRFVTGVGSYWTPEQVTIKSVAATQVRVEDANGELIRIRRSDMTAPRTAGRRGSDHVLVSPDDLRAKRAGVATAIARWSFTVQARVNGHVSALVTKEVAAAADPRMVATRNIAELEAIRDFAVQGIAKLTEQRDLLR